MNTLNLFNTYIKDITTLEPINKGEIGMYHCGPTVYDYLHIGNMRAYVFADTLRRTCEFLGYNVKQVINITDVGHLVSDADDGEDKMEKAAKKNNQSAHEIAEYFTNIFYQNLKALNINTEGTLFPKASEHIPEQIKLIEELEKLGHIYTTTDGVYFDVSTWDKYGKLGNIDLSGLEAGKRVAFNLEKHTPYDFALWKFSADGEKRQQEWPSPWGVGYPGWHIECSAMSMKYLGETFDIHTGGIDHIPVHHNNEIAQSEAVTHKPLANIWMHGAFLNWKDRKMSKSDGSFITLDNLKEQGIPPLAFRYFLLQSKYRQPISFDMETLEASHTAYTRLKNKIQKIWNTELPKEGPVFDHTITDSFIKPIYEICDDLNTPKVLAHLWSGLELIEDGTFNVERDYFERFITTVDKLLGLKLTDSLVEKVEEYVPENIQKMIDERNLAKLEKNWEVADGLRNQIKESGYEITDTPDGTRVKKI